MKRFVLVFVGVLFLLTGCDASGADISPQQATQFVQMLTVTAYTPTPIDTPHPTEKGIADVINQYLQTPEDPLSGTLDATYRVVDVIITGDQAGNLTLLTIIVDCLCARDGDCCNPEHTFVMITRAIKANADKFLGTSLDRPLYIPSTVNQFVVRCYDSQAQMGRMIVSWPLMRDYLMGTITADQLGWTVEKDLTPVP
jgi:hypothetical protein